MKVNKMEKKEIKEKKDKYLKAVLELSYLEHEQNKLEKKLYLARKKKYELEYEYWKALEK